MKNNPIKEYNLDNGLKVLLNSYAGAPSATFMVWYKVGSRNEVIGKTGISHFLEHLSFKKTDLFEKGQIVSEITRNGGVFNAYTSRDFTCYYETFSTSKLELAMIIESQRMNRLKIESMDRDKELGVILSELEKTLDNPYSALENAVRTAAYADHSYRNPVIGYHEDIESITTEDLNSFYDSYYSPNNATVVVSGNFDVDKTYELIKKYFELIPQKTAGFNVVKEKKQKEFKRVTVEKSGSSPIIKLAYHVPPAESSDIYPLIVFSEMLNLGISSRLYQSIVEKQFATDLSINIEIAKDPGLFSILATLYPNISPLSAEQKIIQEIENFITTAPPTDEEVNKTKRRIKSSFEFNKDGTYKLAYLIGYYETVYTYKFIENYINNIEKVTSEDIQRVIKKYLIPENCTIGHFIPTDTEVSRPIMNYDYTPEDTVNHIYTRPPVIMDEVSHGVPVSFEKHTLSNGITVLATENKTSDTVKLYGTINAGNLYSATVNPVLPVMCAGMLNRGCIGLSKFDIAKDVEERGASVGISNVSEAVNFSLSSTVEDFPYMLELLSRILREPAFPEDEFLKYQKFAVAGVEQRKDDAGYLAGIAFSQAIYPKDHIFYVHSLKNQNKQIAEVTIDDVKKFYDDYYSPHTLIMGVSGNISSQKVFNMVDGYFGNWKPINVPVPILNGTELHAVGKEKLVNVPDKTEMEVIYGHFGNLCRQDEDYHKATVMNFILGGGGALSSRIGKRIREDLGLVYSISSGFSALLMPGAWNVKFGIDAKYADVAIDELRQEIERFIKNGANQEELDMAVSYLEGSYPLRFANNAGIAKALLINEFYKLGDNYLNEYMSIIKAVKLSDVNEMAEKYLHPESATVVKSGTFN